MLSLWASLITRSSSTAARTRWDAGSTRLRGNGRSHAALRDYSNFHAADHLREKDWAQRPDGEEVRLWREWSEAIDQLGQEHSDDEKEAAGFRLVAQRNALRPDDVKAACNRVTLWPHV